MYLAKIYFPLDFLISKLIWKPRNSLIEPSNVSQGKQNDYLCTKDLSDFVDCQFENAPWIHACYFGKSTSDEQNYSHLRRLPCCAKEKLFTVRWDLLPSVFDREHHILAVLKFIFWEGHKVLRNLHLTFDCVYCSQK